MHQAIVSIVMPVFNAELHLRQQIDSLLIQTFSEFELIAINDASTDSTVSILSEYAMVDNRVKIYDNEFSKGIAGALNTGLKYAVGKYIARCDGDDIHKVNRLKLQYDFLENNPAIYILGGRAELFDSCGFIRQSVYPETSLVLAWKTISNTYFCHPSVMFRSSIYKEIGGYPIEKSEDFAYFSKILKRYRGANLSQSLLEYRVHDQSYSNQEVTYINESVWTRYHENYLYYVPSLKLVKQFRVFQEQKILSLKFFLPMLIINTKIINKIRNDYGLKFFNLDVISTMIRQIGWIMSATFNAYNVLVRRFLYKIKVKYLIKPTILEDNS